MQGLEMDTGPKYLKLSVLAVVAIVFAAGAYTLTRPGDPGDETAQASEAATPPAAVQPDAAVGSGDTAPAQPGDAAMNSDAAAPAATVANAPAAQKPVTPTATAQKPAASEVAAAAPAVDPATTPKKAKKQSAKPEKAPETAAAAPADATVAQPTEPVAVEPAAMAAASGNANGGSETAAAEQPQSATPAQSSPQADNVTRTWWSSAAGAPSNVEYVGQIGQEKSLAITFSGAVPDPAAAKQHIRVMAEDGTPIDTTWQKGGNERMIVQNDLQPGRYIVMIDPQIANAPLQGPVYIR